MSIQFTKMQALGNDFVVIEAMTQPFSMTSQQIALMGDRRHGIGFDQLLVIEPSHEKSADFIYRIFNADGGEVGQCGNGARCVALYIKTQKLSDKDEVILQTKETALHCRVLSDDRVAVQMGAPMFQPEAIPFDGSQAPTIELEFGVVNVGNPHAVIRVDDVDVVDLNRWGSALAEDPRFPEGVNVSVLAVQAPDAIQLRVFERGVGETEACGSAACAAMTLGYQEGWLDSSVTVTQPGGDLEISWQGTDSKIEMIGPAEFVFRGEYLLL